MNVLQCYVAVSLGIFFLTAVNLLSVAEANREFTKGVGTFGFISLVIHLIIIAFVPFANLVVMWWALMSNANVIFGKK